MVKAKDLFRWQMLKFIQETIHLF